MKTISLTKPIPAPAPKTVTVEKIKTTPNPTPPPPDVVTPAAKSLNLIQGKSATDTAIEPVATNTSKELTASDIAALGKLSKSLDGLSTPVKLTDGQRAVLEKALESVRGENKHL